MKNQYILNQGSKVNGLGHGGFTVTYCTFQMAWEVIEKQDDYEVAFRWLEK